MEQSDSHDGGCRCGAVRFRSHDQPAKSALCHRRYCEMRTGSAFGLANHLKTGQVGHPSGALKSYAFQTESRRGCTTRCAAPILHADITDTSEISSTCAPVHPDLAALNGV